MLLAGIKRSEIFWAAKRQFSEFFSCPLFLHAGFRRDPIRAQQ